MGTWQFRACRSTCVLVGPARRGATGAQYIRPLKVEPALCATTHKRTGCGIAKFPRRDGARLVVSAAVTLWSDDFRGRDVFGHGSLALVAIHRHHNSGTPYRRDARTHASPHPPAAAPSAGNSSHAQSRGRSRQPRIIALFHHHICQDAIRMTGPAGKALTSP